MKNVNLIEAAREPQRPREPQCAAFGALGTAGRTLSSPPLG